MYLKTLLRFRTTITAFAVFLLLIISTQISAQTEKSAIGNFDISKVQQAVENQTDTTSQIAAKTAKKESESYFWVILRISVYLGIIICVILAVGWIVKKAGIGSSSRLGGGGAMDILEVVQFGQNRNAMLVRVMDSVYLLGQTPNSIVLLEKIEGQKALDLIASTKGGAGSVMQFRDVFNNFMGKIKKPV